MNRLLRERVQADVEGVRPRQVHHGGLGRARLRQESAAREGLLAFSVAQTGRICLQPDGGSLSLLALNLTIRQVTSSVSCPLQQLGMVPFMVAAKGEGAQVAMCRAYQQRNAHTIDRMLLWGCSAYVSEKGHTAYTSADQRFSSDFFGFSYSLQAAKCSSLRSGE